MSETVDPRTSFPVPNVLLPQLFLLTELPTGSLSTPSPELRNVDAWSFTVLFRQRVGGPFHMKFRPSFSPCFVTTPFDIRHSMVGLFL